MPSLSPKRFGDDKRDEIGLMVQHRSTAHAVIASSTLLFLFVLLRGGGAADAITAAEGWRYILVVDAGSSGCRMHAYRWRVEDGEVFVDPKHDNLKVGERRSLCPRAFVCGGVGARAVSCRAFRRARHTLRRRRRRARARSRGR